MKSLISKAAQPGPRGQAKIRTTSSSRPRRCNFYNFQEQSVPYLTTYHSSLNNAEFQSVSKIALLPIKTKVKGPVMPQQDETQDDIIDEVLRYFKANVLFRNFEMKGNADSLLVYLTLYTSQCLKKLERCQNKAQADKDLYTLAIENFKLPGDGGFPLNGILPAPEARQQSVAVFSASMRRFYEFSCE